jgi:hypothetical protein
MPHIIRVIKSRRMRLTGRVTFMGEKRNAYRVLVEKSVGHIPRGSPRQKWEDNIKMDLKEIRWEDVDWICLSPARYQWQAVVNILMNLYIL